MQEMRQQYEHQIEQFENLSALLDEGIQEQLDQESKLHLFEEQYNKAEVVWQRSIAEVSNNADVYVNELQSIIDQSKVEINSSLQQAISGADVAKKTDFRFAACLRLALAR